MAANKKNDLHSLVRQPEQKPFIQVRSPVNPTIPLRTQIASALDSYFSHLDGDRPARLYELVLREMEEPLFRAVMQYVNGNQSHAADILGLSRGTLRKKLREHRLSEAH